MSMDVLSDKPLTEDDLDEFLVFLEASDETKCEYTHENAIFPCTMTVRWRIVSCNQAGLICENAHNEFLWRRAQVDCSGCNKRATKCWRDYSV